MPADCSQPSTAVSDGVQLPQKKFYRQRAHANPISDHDIIYPIEPSEMSWSELYGPTAVGKRVEFADIGCGYGGLLMNLAQRYPDVCMVGMEIRVKVSDFVQDKIKALRKSKDGEKYDNICCLRTNAMKYLPNYFGKGQLSKMFFLFPDPHFKKVKYKWRIISANLLAEYAFVLRPGVYLGRGKIYTITDVKDLHEWMVSHISKHPLFRQLSEEEMKEDPVLKLLYNSTEEGQKVTRNSGDKFPAIFVRTENPPE